MASGEALGCGVPGTQPVGRRLPEPPPARQLNVPFDAPGFLFNRFSIRAFNALYFHKQRREISSRLAHYRPFFYPLDSLDHWNRLYGRRGFLQYQCVVPHEGARDALIRMFGRIADNGTGSFLTVLKAFGDLPSPGLLSFPCPGITLALDFPNRGRGTFDLLDELDSIVREVEGRVYPAKDARMSPESFQRFFPEWREFSRTIDPRLSSGFWRRVTATGEER